MLEKYMTVYKKIKDMNFLKLLTNKLQRESNLINKFKYLKWLNYIIIGKLESIKFK